MAEESRRECVVERTAPDDLSLADDFALLADRRRRVVLELLIERGGSVAVADLAEAVAVRENGTVDVERGGHGVRTAYLSLYHRHVPKLADVGLVEFDTDRNMVAVSGDAERLERFVSLAPDGGR